LFPHGVQPSAIEVEVYSGETVGSGIQAR